MKSGKVKENLTIAATDADLAQRLCRGEPQAFHALIDAYGNDLYRLALRLADRPEDAEDLMQETLSGAYHGIDKFSGESSLKTWLYRILVRQSARMIRQRMQERTWLRQAGREIREHAGDGISRQDLSADLARALRELPADQRTVIVLRELQGLSYAEIAAILDLPQGTVESRIHRARKELQTWLQDYLH